MSIQNVDHDVARFAFTPWNATTFFVPLAIQAMSQSLTYPLVSAIVSHGPLGAKEFSAFMQGIIVMFMFGTLGYGLVTTGMVFAKSRTGYQRFARINTLLMFIVAGLQLIMSLPLFGDFLFVRLLGTAPEGSEIARLSMLFSIPAQMAFFMRNVPQVVLFNEHKTAIANWATMLRIALTVILSGLFVKWGWVGWRWGTLGLTLPVFLELGLTWFFARPYVAALEDYEEPAATSGRIFLFNIPLSLGGFLLSLSVLMLNGVVNRTADGAVMLAIHQIAIGIANPASYAALRCQAVAIAFPEGDEKDWRTFFFSLAAGAALAGAVLLLQIPAVAQWYFGHIQNLPPERILLARRVMLAAVFIPLIQALRGHAEGLAAERKRPNAILAGQAVYLASLTVTLFIFYHIGTPGYLIGIYAIVIAIAATFLTIRLGLMLARYEEPLPPIQPRVQHHA